MPAQRLDGNAIANKLRGEIRHRVETMSADCRRAAAFVTA